MNCRMRYYERFQNGERTGEIRRVFVRKGIEIKSDGDISGEDWFLVREKFGHGDAKFKDFFGEIIKTKRMQQYLGLQNPPSRKTTITETVINEDGTITVVEKQKPSSGKRGRTSKYSEDEMKKLAESIISSGLTFGEYIIKEKREGEKSALYARLKNLGINVPQSKKGRKKKVVPEILPVEIAA